MSVLSFTSATSGLFTSPTIPVIWVTETVSRIATEGGELVSAHSPIGSVVSLSLITPHPLAIIPLVHDAQYPLTTPPDVQPVPTTPLLTVTKTSTVTVTGPSPETQPLPSSTTNSSATEPFRTLLEWSSPACMDDLHAFNISKFSSGRTNLVIVPASVVDPNLPSDDCSSLLQLFYPEGSINPAQRPVGGAQFYATPLDLTDARSVTLQYSVYFPEDFDFVLAGKLPGIYGGHAGCSGGNAASECFSTRLMWRRDGQGELYMYAPKDEQTHRLCADPRSVCDAKYGFSIGRGSFRWARGGWTTVRQTVTLNTPGIQDGSFVLEVDGRLVIGRNDIYYRHAPHQRGHHVTLGGNHHHHGLGGILGSLLSDLLPRAQPTAPPVPVIVKDGDSVVEGLDGLGALKEAQEEWGTYAIATFANHAQVTAAPTRLAQQLLATELEEKPIGFEGLFFSTFFGGHDDRYATPKDQYVWFRDFEMSRNL